jgi:signal transduction histidine kinase
MSLRKKIIFSFFISACIIAILVVFESVNFVEVRNEIRSLEVTDTIRSKSLQLRRHEKNFFLYPDKAAEESAAIHDYLFQLEAVTENLAPSPSARLQRLVEEYKSRFGTIEGLLTDVSGEFGKLEALVPHREFAEIVKASFRDRPLYAAQFLEDVYALPPDHPLTRKLRKLASDIDMLRETGEKIIAVSKELDKSARERAEKGIRLSQGAILVVFPLFLLFGVGALFYISSGVVRRLKTLTDSVEKIGEKYASSMPASRAETGGKDEVERLVEKFRLMAVQLGRWEEELHEKNKELLQSKKLAAIGTLAAGVAHELNNPLNNIGISAQVLRRQLGGEASAEVKEILDDIAGQTIRVRGIVGDLLEFAREREPRMKDIELIGLIREAYRLVGTSADTTGVRFVLDAGADRVPLRADPDQLERVFVNLFTNAVSAMEGHGELVVKIASEEDRLILWVSDTGRGMSEEDREKVFDPFFTRKEKGTGLGLAITLNIVKKHGGNISVVSEEGVGTAFEIRLPRRTA